MTIWRKKRRRGDIYTKHSVVYEALELKQIGAIAYVSQPILITPKKFQDNRGWFSEVYNAARELDSGISDTFVQDNLSFSEEKGTVRGIHFQSPPHAQAKLVRCARGRIIDYVIDLRKQSATYGHYVSAELSADAGNQLYVPVGFGHAFITLEPRTEVLYKVSDFYFPDCDAGIRWNCPTIGIDWPLPHEGVTLSEKDRSLPLLEDFVSPFDYEGGPLQLVQR